MKKLIAHIMISLLPYIFILFACYCSNAQNSGTFVDDRDGHEYMWIRIGEQIWMAENLAYLPQINSSSDISVTDPIYCVYEYEGTNMEEAKNNPNYEENGVLYNWLAANTSAPEGWHLPSDEDWEQLAQYISDNYGPYEKADLHGTYGSEVDDWLGIGTHLKSTYGWDNDANGTDDLAFDGKPSGRRYIDGDFYSIGKVSYWWSNAEANISEKWGRVLSYAESSFSRVNYDKRNCLSVRCVKNVNSFSSVPNLSTKIVSEITFNSATSGGNIISDGGSSVTARGVCWNTTGNPTIYDSKTNDGSGMGTFTSNLTGLSENTEYFVRAYATNSEDTGYGNEISFTTNPKTFIITGKVLDSNSNSLENATIAIIDKQNKIIVNTIKSDSQGNFSIELEELGNPLMLSFSKYDPTNNKRFVTKNIDLTSGVDFNEDIYLTPVEGPIISGWFPKESNINKVKAFLNEFSGIFNEISPCLFDLDDDENFIIGFENSSWNEEIVELLHSQNIQVIPTIGYMYSDTYFSNILDKIFKEANANLRTKLINDIYNFVITEGVDGMDIDFESFTASNKEGYKLFIQELQEVLEAKNKILISTIQVPSTKDENFANKIKIDDPNYCFDYISILNNIHNVRLMCYENMRAYEIYPHSECPIKLPEFFTDKDPNNRGFEWQPTLKTLVEMILETRTDKNLANITFALPTYGRNYVYEENESIYNDDITGYYNENIKAYFNKDGNEKLYRMEFGCDATVKSDPQASPENWHWWYQDAASITWIMGYLNELPKHIGICFWQLTDLPPDIQAPLIGYKNELISYPESNEFRLTFESNDELKSLNEENDYFNLQIITPTGRIINQNYWDVYTIENSCPSCDSAFFEILSYGDTTVIKVTDYYPEDGEYQILISTEKDSIGIDYMNLKFINKNDTTVLFEKQNVVVTSIDTIGVIKEQNSIVTKLNEDIDICVGESYNDWSETGQYLQTIFNSLGGDSVIITTNLTVHELPNPDFTYDSDTLTSFETHTSYQWYDQDGAIQGATSKKYIIEKSGTYYLEVTNENGCSGMSEGMNLTKTGINDLSNSKLNLTVFPNPNDGLFRLRFENGKQGKYQIQIVNELGQVQLDKEVIILGNNFEEEFNISHLSSGNYLIRVSDGESENTHKIIVQ